MAFSAFGGRVDAGATGPPNRGARPFRVEAARRGGETRRVRGRETRAHVSLHRHAARVIRAPRAPPRVTHGTHVESRDSPRTRAGKLFDMRERVTNM